MEQAIHKPKPLPFRVKLFSFLTLPFLIPPTLLALVFNLGLNVKVSWRKAE